MPDLSDILAVLRSIASAAVIVVAAYGIGRPLSRLFEDPLADRLERGVRSLLVGFPTAGLALGFLGLVGCLGTVSISLLTLVGLLSASAELACSVAFLSSRGGLVAPIRGRIGMEGPVWLRCLGCTLAAVIVANLITALTPPTNEVVLARALDAPKNALLTGGFTSAEHGGLAWPSLSQSWSLWGLALDGPVTATLVHWLLTMVLALAAVLLARRWVKPEIAWVAGLLVIMAPRDWLQVGSHLDGVAISLAAAFLYLAAGDLRQDGRRSVGQINFAMATLVASLHGVIPAAADLTIWQHPLLLIALGGLMLGASWKRSAMDGAVAVCLAALLLSGGGRVFMVALPAIAVAGAIGTAMLWQLPATARGAIGGLVGCLALVQVADISSAALPKVAVALGWQSRDSYLLASIGSYRAATVFNQIKQPSERLYSSIASSLYFDSPTTLGASASTSGDSLSPARAIEAAHREGCDYVLLTQGVDPTAARPSMGDASGETLSASGLTRNEKFAGAVEVIPIVEYEFADEYQRTTRYRLWKLQGRRAAASPTFESAKSGEEVSSRPRSPTR